MNWKKSVLLTTTSFIIATSMSSCGNAVTTKVDGAAALGRSQEGHLQVVVQNCDGKVDSITFSRGGGDLDNKGTNAEFGTLKASGPQGDTVSVDVQSPASPWSTTSPIALPAGAETVIVVASNRSADSQSRQVSATMDQVGSLKPDQLLVGSPGEIVPRSDLRMKACSSSS